MRRKAAGLVPLRRSFGFSGVSGVFAPVASPPAVSSRPRRPRGPGARQLDRAAQAGLIVFELEFAAMQPRDRGSEAQTQARARLRPALLKPHEAFHDPVAIRIGNAGSTIGDAERNALTLTAGLDHDLRRRAVDLV